MTAASAALGPVMNPLVLTLFAFRRWLRIVLGRLFPPGWKLLR